MGSFRPRLHLVPPCIALALCGIVSTACETTSPTPPASEVETLGFLERYDQLEPGRKGEARLVFVDFAADFSPYERVIVDRVIALPAGTPEDLARSFDALLREELAIEFVLVEEPEPGTLRIRTAVTEKRTSLLGFEIEVVDATSRERLVAAVDERPVPVGDAARARAQQEAELARWAALLRTRLAAFRSYDTARRARNDEAAP